MYCKEINGRLVFSTCKTICLEYDHPPLTKGQWVSNPDSQLIYDEDWRIYVPPEVEPVKATEPEFEQVVNAVKKMFASSVSGLTDEEALEVAAIYPTWVSVIGKPVNVGERYWFNEKLYKVIQAHTAQMDWEPDITPALYVEVSIIEFPEWKQPVGSEDAYNKGDKVSHNGKKWVSDVDANVWEPGAVGTESLWLEIN